MKDKLAQALLASTPVMHKLATVLKAQMQQFYSVDDLAERYKLTADQVREILKHRGIYKPQRGKRVRIHLDDVIALDTYFSERRRYDAG